MSCLVSVVVPTYRRPELLRRCLAALLAQDFDPAGYEIIIADDAASSSTRRLVEDWTAMRDADSDTLAIPVASRLAHPQGAHEFVSGAVAIEASPSWARPLDAAAVRWQYCDAQRPIATAEPPPAQASAKPRIHYIPVVGAHGPAAARNAGWRAARGSIIAFTDDDCVPEPGWLRGAMNAFADGIDGVSGRVVVPLPDEPTDYEYNAAGLARGEFVTANCFYRSAALAAVGGFDQRFTTAWREDSDLQFTLLERGCCLVHAPDAIVVHPVRPAPWGISLRQQRKSMFNALLFKKHPTLYRRHIQPTPPWRYYATVGALLLAIAGALLGWYWMTLGALAIWLLLTAAFCARRLRGTSRTPRHLVEMFVTSALIPPLAVFWRLRGALKFRVFFL
jgi:glycosyltransferase involved in cell wall biosynthesis